VQRTQERDASGNARFGDIGLFLRDHINAHFKGLKKELNLKYIDPSYTIRSVPANGHDSAFCLLLGQNAVHAGMAVPKIAINSSEQGGICRLLIIRLTARGRRREQH